VYSVDQSSERLDGVTAQQVLIDLKTGDIRATNVSGETVR